MGRATGLPNRDSLRSRETGRSGLDFSRGVRRSGLGYIEYAIAIEELAKVDPSVALSAAALASLATNHLFLQGSDEQRRKYLPKLVTSQWIGCWSLTEPEAGSDAAGTRTTAIWDRDHWLLNGSKTFTTNFQRADVCLATAVTEPSSEERRISAFVVKKWTVGFRTGRKENKLGMLASDTGEVIFSDCRLPRCHLVGEEGQGFADAMKVLDGGRFSIAALSVGIAQGAYEAALAYSKQRRHATQHGRSGSAD